MSLPLPLTSRYMLTSCQRRDLEQISSLPMLLVLRGVSPLPRWSGAILPLLHSSLSPVLPPIPRQGWLARRHHRHGEGGERSCFQVRRRCSSSYRGRRDGHGRGCKVCLGVILSGRSRPLRGPWAGYVVENGAGNSCDGNELLRALCKTQHSSQSLMNGKFAGWYNVPQTLTKLSRYG